MDSEANGIEKVFVDSESLAAELLSLVHLPLFDESNRLRTSDILCSLSLEHWHAIRGLLSGGLLPSATIVHRGQFEAIVRSLWVLYGATDDQLSRLSESELTAGTEQAAKNLPQTNDMMAALSKKAPVHAYEALQRFKDNSWKALNSYAHAGIHPLRRHESGYPVELIISILKNANGLAVVACMQAVALSGAQPLQRAVLDVAAKYPHCMPPRL